jgi:nucleoside 2-deoxyribosyltransferase
MHAGAVGRAPRVHADSIPRPTRPASPQGEPVEVFGKEGVKVKKAVIYLCGPIHGKHDSDCRVWRERVKELLAEHYHTFKYEILDPMDRDYRGLEQGNEAAIVNADLGDIDASDFVIVNASEPSWGTAMEVFYSKLAEKVVIAFSEGDITSPWLKHHVTHVCKTVEAACVCAMKLNADRVAAR